MYSAQYLCSGLALPRKIVSRPVQALLLRSWCAVMLTSFLKSMQLCLIEVYHCCCRVKKNKPPHSAHTFAKYWPIFKIQWHTHDKLATSRCQKNSQLSKTTQTSAVTTYDNIHWNRLKLYPASDAAVDTKQQSPIILLYHTQSHPYLVSCNFTSTVYTPSENFVFTCSIWI